MSKYDFAVDLSAHSSTGMILSKIPFGSTVLEFGCACGRMTRYLKEALHCWVYIVECNPNDYAQAEPFAADGICGDILSLSWTEKWKGILFDAILFADVLEHLTDPDCALSHAGELLKDDGHIYVSVPNIAHNDILLKLFHNRFDYTRLGILDDTHVHFWAYENLVPFVQSNGLFVYRIEATYCPMGQTEQYEQADPCGCTLFLNFLRERDYGQAYQFILTLGKDEKQSGRTNMETADPMHNHAVTGCLYFDRGNGFHQTDTVVFPLERIQAGMYTAHVVCPDMEQVKRVRFDPVETQGCIVRNLSFRQGGEKLDCAYSNHLNLEEGILLYETDPMVFAELTDSGTLTIDADIILPGDRYLELLQEGCLAREAALEQGREQSAREIGGLQARNQKLCGEISRQQEQNEQFHQEINGLQEQNKRLEMETKRLEMEIERLVEQHRQEMDGLKAQNEKLHMDLDTYRLIADRKDELLIQKERQIGHYEELRILKLRHLGGRALRAVGRKFTGR